MRVDYCMGQNYDNYPEFNILHNGNPTKVWVKEGKIEEWIEWANSMGNGTYTWVEPLKFEAFRVLCSYEEALLLEKLALKAGYKRNFLITPDCMSFGINNDKLFGFGVGMNWGSALKQVNIDEAIRILSVPKKIIEHLSKKKLKTYRAKVHALRLEESWEIIEASSKTQAKNLLKDRCLKKGLHKPDIREIEETIQW